MNQEFRLNFNQQSEDDLDTSSDTQNNDVYDTPGNIRNLCFVWPDGRMKFLNYAYLISGEFQQEENCIVLSFTASNVIITGTNLIQLFQLLVNHIPKKIKCEETRYSDLRAVNSIFIKDVIISNT